MEFLTLIFVCFLGIFFGILSGLIPGLHINMVSSFIMSNISLLFGIFEINELVIFVISMSVTHTFFDFIPSILIGIPNPDTALSTLPGHVLVFKGEAYKAIFLSALGSLFGSFISLFVSIMFYFTLNSFYDTFKLIVPYLLALSVVILIITEKENNKRFWSLIIILFSGGYGLLILNSKLINEPLLILFSGIFGVSSIVYSLFYSENGFPKQDFGINYKFDKRIFKGLIAATISSSLCAITPGIGNSQAAMISSMFFKKLTSEIFIVVLSAINTINFVPSIITFYIIERARNGSIVAISQIVENVKLNDVLLYYVFILIVSIVCFFLMMILGKIIIKSTEKINFKIISIVVLCFIFTLVFLFDGYLGILGLLGGAFLGLLCILLEVRRIHLMSVLIIPILFNIW